MKFLFRSFIVLAVAVGLGFLLYFAVQALPNNSPATNSPTSEVAPQNGLNSPENPISRPASPARNRNGGIRWGSLGRMARRIIVFAVIVFIGVIGINLVFGRRLNKKKMNK